MKIFLFFLAVTAVTPDEIPHTPGREPVAVTAVTPEEVPHTPGRDIEPYSPKPVSRSDIALFYRKYRRQKILTKWDKKMEGVKGVLINLPETSRLAQEKKAMANVKGNFCLY